MEHEKRLTTINTKDITVDRNGQRDVEDRQAEFHKIMREYDPDLMDPICVAYVDRKYYCYDGQMRMKVAKAMNGGKNVSMQAMIIYGLTLPEVADLFLKRNDPSNSSPTKLADRIRVAANYGSAEESEFIDIVEKNGFKIDRRRDSNNSGIYVGATKALWNEYLSFKTDSSSFDDCMRILHEAYSFQKLGTTGKIIKGLGLLVRTYKGKFKVQDMITSLEKTNPLNVITSAEGGRKSPKASDYAEQMVNAYNSKRRGSSKLDITLLRGAK